MIVAAAAPRLGRLFWKFFAIITLVQMLSILAVGAWIYSEHRAATSGQAIAGAEAGPPQRGGLERPVLPPEPIIGGVLASLGSAAVLAWLLSKPIRKLRQALEDAAAGNLGVRVADAMGGGSDELRDLGHEFDRMVGQLQSLVGAQRQLLHDVSHEMRSPLARIQVAIGLASQQSGQEGARHEDIDLQELLGVIVNDAQYEARASGRSVRLEPSAGAFVRGNVELLRRAIENVIRNAIKYSHDGGAIVVGVEPAEDARSVIVAVRDNGPEAACRLRSACLWRAPTRARPLTRPLTRPLPLRDPGSRPRHRAPRSGSAQARKMCGVMIPGPARMENEAMMKITTSTLPLRLPCPAKPAACGRLQRGRGRVAFHAGCLAAASMLIWASGYANAEEHARGGEARSAGHPSEPHAGPSGYQRPAEPKGWNERPSAVDRGAYQHNFQAARAYHIGPYQRPRGWVDRRWVFGQILPRAFWAAQYIIADYWLFGLEVPPGGYEWVRYGPDALMINVQNGEVLQAEYGVFG